MIDALVKNIDILERIFDLGITAVVTMGIVYMLLKMTITPWMKGLHGYAENVAQLAEETGKVADRIHKLHEKIDASEERIKRKIEKHS